MQPHYSNLQNFFPLTRELKLLFAAGVEFNEGEVFAETEKSSLWSFQQKKEKKKEKRKAGDFWLEPVHLKREYSLNRTFSLQMFSNNVIDLNITSMAMF